MNTLDRPFFGELDSVLARLNLPIDKQAILQFCYESESDFPKRIMHISQGVKVVPINMDQPVELSDKLEYHKHAADLHYIIGGVDEYRLRLVIHCRNEYLQYQPDDDYGLYSDSPNHILTLKKGEAIYINTKWAHMALCGSGEVRKLVFKLSMP